MSSLYAVYTHPEPLDQLGSSNVFQASSSSLLSTGTPAIAKRGTIAPTLYDRTETVPLISTRLPSRMTRLPLIMAFHMVRHVAKSPKSFEVKLKCLDQRLQRKSRTTPRVPGAIPPGPLVSTIYNFVWTSAVGPIVDPPPRRSKTTNRSGNEVARGLRKARRRNGRSGTSATLVPAAITVLSTSR